jgi:hypothetical protein
MALTHDRGWGEYPGSIPPFEPSRRPKLHFTEGFEF